MTRESNKLKNSVKPKLPLENCEITKATIAPMIRIESTIKKEYAKNGTNRWIDLLFWK